MSKTEKSDEFKKEQQKGMDIKMEKRNIVNLLHFVRGVNQNHPELEYMHRTVREYVRMMREYDLPCTILLQYDALIDPAFTDFLKENADRRLEVGLWLEVPRQLTEAVGVEWHGHPEWTWDWHTNVGYLIGYQPAERRLMIEEAMETFSRIFGVYPSSVGCWMLDAVSLAHLADRYAVDAACICRDQWGIDGMSLWGGYDSIYYPSRNHMLCPGSDENNQIDLPVIRMLVNDPMYNYDINYTRSRLPELGGAEFFTMEPAFPCCGGNENWVNWIFKQLTSEATQPYSYAQIGQENGFGWERTAKGIEYQCRLVKKLAEEGKVIPEKVSDTGKWFRKSFPVTPSNTVAALDDWTGKGRKSVWYYSKHYRMNVFQEDKKLWIRDWRQFRAELPELYLNAPCTEHGCQYTSPPLVEGLMWSDEKVRAGLYPARRTDGRYTADVTCEDIHIENGDGKMSVRFQANGNFFIECQEREVIFQVPEDCCWKLRFKPNASLRFVMDGAQLTVLSKGAAASEFSERGSTWAVAAQKELEAVVMLSEGRARLDQSAGELILLPENGRIRITC